MRPTANGVGDIGDGITLAVVGGGVVDQIGAVRQYNAVNPFNIGAEGTPAQALALFSCGNVPGCVTALMPDALYPMTFHQRLYQWPATGIGEVRLAGSPSVDKSYPPKEVPVGQMDWSAPPITAAPIFRIDDEVAPLMGEQTLDAETPLPAKCIPFMEFRTLYKTSPWVPTAFVGNNPYGGDTRKWFMAGVTKDGVADTPLGSCDVIVMRVDKQVVNPDVRANPVVGVTVSDASTGAYSVQVAANVLHQVLAYKTGSPDRAGATLETVMPTDG